MKRRIAWLVAATTSAVILAFVIPLCLLVRELAQDRAMATGEQEARNLAVLISGLHDDPDLPDLVAAVDARSSVTTSVLTPRRTTLGRPVRRLAQDEDVLTAMREHRAFTVHRGGTGKVLVPVVTAEGTFVVRTTVPPPLLRAGVTRAWSSIAVLGAILIVLSLTVAVRMGARISTPVNDLARVAVRFRDGDLDARADVRGPPETAWLARIFNQLAERVTELLQAERSQVGDLSHRLRTPITALRLDAESVRDEETARRLQEHIFHLQRTVDSVVRDARRPLQGTMRASCDAGEVVRERMQFWAALAEDQGRPLVVDIEPGILRVPLDAGGLADVLDVVVDNVFAHTPDEVAFGIEVRRRGDWVRLEVADDGPGLADDAGGGHRPGSTGQGLQILRRSVAAVGGEVTVTGEAGTSVVLLLPLMEG